MKGNSSFDSLPSIKMLQDAIPRLTAQRATCKQLAIVLAVAILLTGALGRLNPVSVLWAAAPLLLLGLVEASYAARERQCRAILSEKEGGAMAIPPVESEFRVATRIFFTVFSPSIWPFYLGLSAFVVAGAFSISSHETAHLVSSAIVANPVPSLAGKPNMTTAIPPNVPRRLPNGTIVNRQAVQNSAIQRNTPAAFPRATPINFGSYPAIRQPVRPAATPGGPPTPVRQNP